MQSRKRKNTTLSQEDIPELIFKGKEKDTAVTGEIIGACKRKIGQILGVNVFTAYSECDLANDTPIHVCIFSSDQDKSKLAMIIYRPTKKEILAPAAHFINTINFFKPSLTHASNMTVTRGAQCYNLNLQGKVMNL